MLSEQGSISAAFTEVPMNHPVELVDLNPNWPDVHNGTTASTAANMGPPRYN